MFSSVERIAGNENDYFSEDRAALRLILAQRQYLRILMLWKVRTLPAGAFDGLCP
jgi:hypothetical protein